jgi:MFS family permease
VTQDRMRPMDLSSYRALVAGAYSVGMAVGGSTWSRLADRRGGKGVLIATGMAWTVAMTGLALLLSDLFRLMPLVSALGGAVVPPVTATLRAAWPRLVQGPQLRAVYCTRRVGLHRR